ncbi:hypothetical protein MRX96_015290 [Rhipicephalus microplus]
MSLKEDEVQQGFLCASSYRKSQDVRPRWASFLSFERMFTDTLAHKTPLLFSNSPALSASMQECVTPRRCRYQELNVEAGGQDGRQPTTGSVLPSCVL